jgi:hypothetical protein
LLWSMSIWKYLLWSISSWGYLMSRGSWGWG